MVEHHYACNATICITYTQLEAHCRDFDTNLEYLEHACSIKMQLYGSYIIKIFMRSVLHSEKSSRPVMLCRTDFLGFSAVQHGIRLWCTSKVTPSMHLSAKSNCKIKARSFAAYDCRQTEFIKWGTSITKFAWELQNASTRLGRNTIVQWPRGGAISRLFSWCMLSDAEASHSRLKVTHKLSLKGCCNLYGIKLIINMISYKEMMALARLTQMSEDQNMIYTLCRQAMRSFCNVRWTAEIKI